MLQSSVANAWKWSNHPLQQKEIEIRQWRRPVSLLPDKASFSKSSPHAPITQAAHFADTLMTCSPLWTHCCISLGSKWILLLYSRIQISPDLRFHSKNIHVAREGDLTAAAKTMNKMSLRKRLRAGLLGENAKNEFTLKKYPFSANHKSSP